MSARVVVLVGPTASGKSALAVALARALAGEVVNADSRQVYRELGVAVAKPSAGERGAVPHHLVDYVSVHEPYSAGHWARDARACLDERFAAGVETCIVSGGAGLHVRALVEGIPDMPEVGAEARARAQQVFAKAGLPGLQQAVQARDPAYYAEVDERNPHRLLRALAVMEATGATFSELRARPRSPLPYPAHYVVLDPPREELYARIDTRVEEMLAAGLEAEARTLYAHRHLDALNTIGYREWWPYLEGDQAYAKTVELIKRNSRRYARRQLTWNRRLRGLRLAQPDAEAVLAYLREAPQHRP